jgi:uncharacterized SAM-binding protein YcdF (DUF218 family)
VKVVVVHGHRDPGCTRISEECARRVAAADGIAANVAVYSGAGIAGERSEALQMFHAARTPRRRVRLEQRSEDTAENARFGMREALVVGATHVVVVTSWWHVPRSWLEWRRAARRSPDPPRVSFLWARGSWRYVPGEIRALWGWR